MAPRQLFLLILAAAGALVNTEGASSTANVDVDASDPSVRYSLPGAGGSGPFEAVTDLISAFEAKFPEADLSISSVGTGASQAALWGDVDCEKKPVEGVCGTPLEASLFGIGGVPLDPEDKWAHQDLELHQIPAFSGPILVVYSKDVTGELGLDTSQQINMSHATIAGIFNGSIDSWNHPKLQAENPWIELPEERITVLVRPDKSGMSQTFTEFLHHTNPDSWPEEAVGKKPKWPLSNITDLSESQSYADDGFHQNWKADGQTGIGIGLLRRPFSIGFLELGYFSTLTQFVAQAYVSGPSHPHDFEPATVETLRTVMDGLSSELDTQDLSLNMVEEDTPVGGYPISRYTYWYIKKSAEGYTSCYQAWLLYTFLRWAYTDPLAAEIVLGHGWVIPPSSVVQKVATVLEQIKCTIAPGEEQEGVVDVGDLISVASFTPPPLREVEEEEESNAWVMAVLFSLLALLLVALAAIGYYHFVVKARQKKKADTVWTVKYDEIKFANPPEVIGAGTFGLVLLGNYRGTEVAVKRVIPPRDKKKEGESDGIGFSDPEHDLEAARRSKTLSNHGTRSVVGMTKSDAISFAKMKADFIEEMRYLSKLRHPCITMIMGAVVDSGPTKDPLLVMEYCMHGSLYDIIHNKSAVLEGDFLLPILRDISQGVLFLHAATPQCIHSDLKTMNILVDSKFRGKVSDFGLSAKSQEGASGTPFWMAPELLRGESTSTAASDVYSIGVIFYEMYSRKDPYDGAEDYEFVLKEIADPSINRRPNIPNSCPPEIVSLMKDCWQSDPKKRPLMDEIDSRLKRLDVANAEPGDVLLSRQLYKNAKAAKSEDLLHKVFPKHIAEALREGRKVEPEHHECVSIFFSDIVGFTTISSQISPAKVSDMLDRLYGCFDALSHKHDVFKIETIGDAYLCVTNLVSKQDNDHVKRIAEFSLDAIQAAGETLIDLDNPDMGFVQIRVGFNSGPVVASVVGSRLPKFTMFGDTINCASRMESNSSAGRIHCSKASAELLALQCPELLLTSRGELDIKGKGLMETFWVEAGAGFHVGKDEKRHGSDGSVATVLTMTTDSHSSDGNPTGMDVSGSDFSV